MVPYGLATSDRAHLEGLNLVGMNRRGFDKKQSIEASIVMKEMFDDNSAMVFNKRVERAKEEYPENKVIQEIVEFLQKDNSRTFCRYK